MTFADRVISFTLQLKPPELELPVGFEWLFPYNSAETVSTMTAFYQKYYADNRERNFILGINPGRFGAGLTGVPFTDPVRLESCCGITTSFARKAELSAIFVWEVINAYGGPEAFCQDFYITSLVPLGLVRDGKNINYYDDRQFCKTVEPYIKWNLDTQLAMGGKTGTAICLGEGQNFGVFQKVNGKYSLFGRIEPLPHPRFVMQYRRKRMQEYIDLYLKTLETALIT